MPLDDTLTKLLPSKPCDGQYGSKNESRARARVKQTVGIGSFHGLSEPASAHQLPDDAESESSRRFAFSAFCNAREKSSELYLRSVAIR